MTNNLPVLEPDLSDSPRAGGCGLRSLPASNGPISSHLAGMRLRLRTAKQETKGRGGMRRTCEWATGVSALRCVFSLLIRKHKHNFLKYSYFSQPNYKINP